MGRYFPGYDNRADRGGGEAIISAIEHMRANRSSPAEVRAFTDRVSRYYEQRGASAIELRTFATRVADIVAERPDVDEVLDTTDEDTIAKFRLRMRRL